MKKIFTVLMTMCFAITLVACSNTTKQENEPVKEEEKNNQKENTAQHDQSIKEEGKSLVVYFSWSGNTEAVAKEIQSQTRSEIFKINPQTPYTDDYDELLDIAQKEQSENARPVIAQKIENFEEYDTIYLGYPNWWGDMPMIIYSYLDDYDLSGKTILPFCTSGGSGFSSSIDTIKQMEPNAKVLDGLAISDDHAKNASKDIEEWLNK